MSFLTANHQHQGTEGTKQENITLYWLQRFSESSELAGRNGWSSGAFWRCRVPHLVPVKKVCAFNAA